MLEASGWPGGREARGSGGRLVEEQEKPLRQNVIVPRGADDTLLGHRGRICRALGGWGVGGGGLGLCVDVCHLRGALPTFPSTLIFRKRHPRRRLRENSGMAKTRHLGRGFHSGTHSLPGM